MTDAMLLESSERVMGLMLYDIAHLKVNVFNWEIGQTVYIRTFILFQK